MRDQITIDPIHFIGVKLSNTMPVYSGSIVSQTVRNVYCYGQSANSVVEGKGLRTDGVTPAGLC